jgi:glutamate formiminotransferase / formiminotetrahydrofolate cyclodeaminase
MNKIVECVPNFSEGRRPEVVDAIVDAITSVSGVYLLGREMDTDHNRAVITVVGSPESIGAAAVRGVEVAMRHIDLTRHQGGHPRIGAADVIPFVPIRGVTLEECVQIAKSVGREIAEKFHIPVYLYEAAATRPERTNLENIRRGQFEVLREEIETKPERKPDFGEARIHPTAGATVVGARKPLIAYNINLDTPDLEIAKQIAKRIRFSSGGFPYVKAMGLLLKERNQAQVSMNLTDYEQTSIEVVFEAVGAEANRHGTRIVGSEIVGLVPQKALDQVAVASLLVEDFHSDMILENRLEDVMASVRSNSTSMAEGLRGFVERVASAEPMPGGGCVAALAGALGAALGQMSIRITREKKDFQRHLDRYTDALDRLAPYASTLLELVDADAEAYKRVLTAYKLPKTSPDRDNAIQQALIRATEIPSRTANCAAEALRVLEDLRSIIYPNVASDLQVGLQMLRSALRGAIANMRINLTHVKDSTIRLRYEDMIVNWEQVLRGG